MSPPQNFNWDTKHLTALRDLLARCVEAFYPDHDMLEHTAAAAPVTDEEDVIDCHRCQMLRAIESIPATTQRYR